MLTVPFRVILVMSYMDNDEDDVRNASLLIDRESMNDLRTMNILSSSTMNPIIHLFQEGIFLSLSFPFLFLPFFSLALLVAHRFAPQFSPLSSTADHVQPR